MPMYQYNVYKCIEWPTLSSISMMYMYRYMYLLKANGYKCSLSMSDEKSNETYFVHSLNHNFISSVWVVNALSIKFAQKCSNCQAILTRRNNIRERISDNVSAGPPEHSAIHIGYHFVIGYYLHYSTSFKVQGCSTSCISVISKNGYKSSLQIRSVFGLTYTQYVRHDFSSDMYQFAWIKHQSVHFASVVRGFCSIKWTY